MKVDKIVDAEMIQEAITQILIIYKQKIIYL